MEIKKFRTKISLLPTLPKVYTQSCKPESKSKQLFVFFQNAHTEPLMPSTKYLLKWFVSGSLKEAGESCSNRSQGLIKTLIYKFSVQKSRTENIKQQHFLLNTIPWHTEQQGTPIQKNAVVPASQHRHAENKAYSCA